MALVRASVQEPGGNIRHMDGFSVEEVGIWLVRTLADVDRTHPHFNQGWFQVKVDIVPDKK